MSYPNCCAVIVAAGSSARMGSGISKQLISLCGKPSIVHTLLAFDQAASITSVVLVVRKGDKAHFETLIHAYKIKKVCAMAAGGSTRQKSVTAGVAVAPSDTEYFAVHDGARALITPEEIDCVVQDAFTWGASALAAPVKDTIKLADNKNLVVATPDRSRLWTVQTPQVFEKKLYLEALRLSQKDDADYTDDCQLVEHIGTAVHLCKGSYTNLKLTTPEDIYLAEAILKNREAAK